ncbi:DUF402 domain-containing protein [Kitasatospora sp. MMS16-BH015]|uniref:DUF402 domain-containing protein n=1 Tax=Kitasatospora sp. MMS16-BH015 TaxID=2018025 RepID=UPI00131A59A8|nr:DUF402 domain-containing protein [Kitasatospora sp. MMS16-BH015]
MTDTSLFQPGTTVLRRDVHAGRVWTAMPQRVIDDTGRVLTLAGLLAGDRGPVPDDLDHRDPHRRRHHPQAGPRRPGGRHLDPRPLPVDRHRPLSHFLACEWFSVHCFQDATTHEPLRWYVNFEKPYQRHAGGIDTMDLALDLVLAPDLSGQQWKDRHEYSRLRRPGVIDDFLHHQVEQAQGRAIAMLDNRTGPFAGGWPAWAPDPAWPLPTLPDHADAPAIGR